MNNTILNINNLSKSYYTKEKEILVLNNINLKIKDQSITAIVGPSGCGKTTLLNIIGNLDTKTKGELLFTDNKNKIGYMFQNDTLFPWLTILDNCLIGLKVRKELTKENIQYVKKLLNNYGLQDFINSYPNNLSGGMRQRVALIRTLAIKPDILLLDEPFSSLDYQSKLTVTDDVYKIIKKEKKTTIIITHDIGEAISIADTIIVLSNRPAKIKKIYNIKLTNAKSPITNRNCKEFNNYYKQIWESIDHHV
ncbi:MAG: ATP-binding cassette domain-containing protein [Bacilli bacterium]|nr:ATP-binding cassette domain-containing protein [Bacilli bacterium]